jgi:hypothetical protein
MRIQIRTAALGEPRREETRARYEGTMKGSEWLCVWRERQREVGNWNA